MCTTIYPSTFHHRETFHLEPLSRHLPGETGTHNTIIYKSSDVVYDLEHTACSSLQSPRLRHIQVGWKPSIDIHIYHRHMQPMGLPVLYMYVVPQFSNSFHKCCSSELQFKILKLLLVQTILCLLHC